MHVRSDLNLKSNKMKKLLTVLFSSLLSLNLLISQTNGVKERPPKLRNFRPEILNITELNFGFGLGDVKEDYSKGFVGLTSVLGYTITKNINIGFGTGFSSYNGGMLFPVFLDLRGMLNFGKLSAYFFGDGGLILNFSDTDYENRIMLNPGIGLKFSLTEKLSGNVGGGLLIQTTPDRGKHDSFINLKLGLTYLFSK